MRYLIEHMAVIFGAATGALAARGRRIDLFGVIVLGMVTAVGGGTLRDLVLDVPVFWVTDSTFVLSGTAAAVATFFFARYVERSAKLFPIVDAFFLAFVATLGTHKTHLLHHSGTICVVFGVVTGVAGGILRDLLVGEVPIVFRSQTYLYATAALVGAVAYLAATTLKIGTSFDLAVGASTILILRLAAIRWRWKLPTFHTPEEGIG